MTDKLGYVALDPVDITDEITMLKAKERYPRYEGPISLAWKGPVPLDDIVERTIADIRTLWGLGKPSSLIFHHADLIDDVNGPCVMVWGVEGDDEHFHCEYLENGDNE